MVMKLIIEGSRDIKHPYDKVLFAIDKFQLTGIEEIYSGTAVGIDQAGEEYDNKRNIHVKQFQADSSISKKSAGMVRTHEIKVSHVTLLPHW